MKKYRVLIIVTAFLFLVNAGYAKPGLIKDIGIGTGIVYPQGGWNLGYTIQAQTNFGEVLDYLFFVPFIYYSASGKTEEAADVKHDMVLQYIGFGTKIVGYLNAKPRGFYMGGSLSYNVISSESLFLGYIDQNSNVESTTTAKLGFGALAGYKLAFKNFSAFIETSYILVPGGYNTPTVQLGTSINL